MTNAFDVYLRRNAVALNTQPSTLNSFSYDNAGRLQGVTNGYYNAGYSYVVNSPLVGQLVFKNNSTTRMTTIKQYDFLNRLQSIGSVGASSTSPLTFAYTYNDANQRTRVNLAGGSFWIYEYDALGQVKSGKRYWSDWTPVAGQQFEYGFDDIGNRTSTKAGGDEHGADLRYASYTANSLNQYTQRTVPGYVDIMGIGLATNSVTVNSPTPTPYRRGEYFRKELSVNNTSTSVWQSVTVASPGQTSVSGNVLLAKTPQAFTYDADGNLTSDGLWTNRWNAENRLISTESLTTVPSAARMKEEWSYFADGRWKERIVSAWSGSVYVGQYTNRYIWDGKVLLAVLDHTNGLIMSFMRGLDLSGTPQGAGGVGGVLAINIKTNGTHLMAYDGNGNVVALVSGTDGTVSANYEYDPFGKTIRITGAVAKANPIRFSTQYADDVTGDLKYLYRDYVPKTGRWRNRDPMEELQNAMVSYREPKSNNERQEGNLYSLLRNSPINAIDIYGLVYYCESATVDIFVPPHQPSFNEGEMLAELRAVVPEQLGVYWHVIHGNLPPGSHLGDQGGELPIISCNCLYFIQAEIKNSVITSGHRIVPYFDAWGYGAGWIATGFIDSFKWDFDDDISYLPANWQNSNSSLAWQKFSGFVMAHEVLHTVGASHTGGHNHIMSPSGTWNWLNANIIPADPRTATQVTGFLRHWRNVTN